ncbi:DJ-1/PfpI family protein [Poronia punctata]|nr:DJ-1/PfpI family protein [Poronia punctata]
MAPKVLVVLTSHGYIESAKKPTGWYLPELSHPYDVFRSAGIEVVTASPKGGHAPLDPASVEASKDDASAMTFSQTQSFVWENTAPISTFLGRASEFAALFYPGGHGPVFDLVENEDSLALIEEFAEMGKPVAAVCHGPVAFLNAKGGKGGEEKKGLIEGRDVTGFSNEEEDQVGMTKYMPVLYEDGAKARGANYKKADKAWGELVIVQDGGKLITGQNPASAKGVGEAIVKAINGA